MRTASRVSGAPERRLNGSPTAKTGEAKALEYLLEDICINAGEPTPEDAHEFYEQDADERFLK
jgi:hypothetical protein